MQSRREFLQLATITAMLIGGKSWNAVAAKQEISENDLLKFDSKGQLTLLHITCLLYTSPSPRDLSTSRMPSSA